MAKPKVGYDMVLARNTGTFAAPAWSALDEVGDVSVSGFTMGTAELKRRKKRGNKVVATGLSPPEIEFRLHHGLDATNYNALKTAFLAGTPVLFGIFNGSPATNGTEGWHIPCIVTEFPWDQPLEDISGHDIKLQYAYYEESNTEVDMAWITISGQT